MRFKSLRSFESLNFSFKVYDDRLIVNYVNHLSIGVVNDLTFGNVLHILIEVEEVLIELLSRWVYKLFARTHMFVPQRMALPS